MSSYQHPDEVGGGVFIFLFVLFIGYAWFLYEGVGNFKQCDSQKYPLALICINEKAKQ